VSQKHCRIFVEDGKAYIENFSDNGVVLGDKPFYSKNERIYLNDKSIIEIEGKKFRFEYVTDVNPCYF
jgi:pSer/pThr/pTyr-binding forkhead associated (FHA) protein